MTDLARELKIILSMNLPLQRVKRSILIRSNDIVISQFMSWLLVMGTFTKYGLMCLYVKYAYQNYGLGR